MIINELSAKKTSNSCHIERVTGLKPSKILKSNKLSWTLKSPKVVLSGYVS